MLSTLILIVFVASVTALLCAIYYRRKTIALAATQSSGREDNERFLGASQRSGQATTPELEQKLLDRTRELAALNAVALALGQAANLKDVFDKSLIKIFDSLDHLESRGAVFLCEPDGETLRLTAQQGLSPALLQREEIIRMSGSIEKAVLVGDVLYMEHGYKNASPAQEETLGSEAHIIVPIKSRGIVLGVIFLYPTAAFRLKLPDLQMLEIIGAQLGLAVENFRFYAEVKEASHKYWDLFENARDILFTVDSYGRLAAVNKAAEEFSGYSRTELIGKNVRDFLTRESVQTALHMLAGSLPRVIELEVIKRDNSRAFIEVSARKLSASTDPSGFQISARDATEQKNLRDLLLKAERLGAIGQVGVAMRHEINNPLTTVIGNLELLLERHDGKDRETADRLTIILNNALRIAEIIKRVEEIKQDKVVEYLKGIK